MTITEKQADLINDFDFLENWEQKYEYLIDIGKSLPPMPEENKTEENLIQGCQSRVWLNAEQKNGKLLLHADSDGILPKGIIALLVSVYHNQPIEDIVKDDFSFIGKIGLQEFLSPSRANGLLAMTKQIKLYALAFQLQS